MLRENAVQQHSRRQKKSRKSIITGSCIISRHDYRNKHKQTRNQINKHNQPDKLCCLRKTAVKNVSTWAAAYQQIVKCYNTQRCWHIKNPFDPSVQVICMDLPPLTQPLIPFWVGWEYWCTVCWGSVWDWRDLTLIDGVCVWALALDSLLMCLIDTCTHPYLWCC